MFGGNFAPVGWALCDGQLLAIAENDALFALVGTTYGGDGLVTFALPDLRGRVPLHNGSVQVAGSAAGLEAVTLVDTDVPGHTHAVRAAPANGNAVTPEANVLAASPDTLAYSSGLPDAALAAGVVGASGASAPLPHNNVQPYQCFNFIIALAGIFPSPA